MPGPLTIRSTLSLAAGVELPRLGLGVYLAAPGAETQDAVRAALDAGYRHVDTAKLYGNEQDVGAAIRGSGVPRDEVWITTKLWNSDHGHDRALRAFDASLARLGLERVDLFLVHWPVEGLRRDTWRAMERILADGRARAVGVSNYTVRHLEELLGHARTPPAVNQVEMHPFLAQAELRAWCARHGIAVEAYSPLVHGERMDDPVLRRVAAKHRRSVAQVLVRWGLQHGVAVLPKSVRARRIRENADVFGFELDASDMAALDGLDEDLHTDWDPTDAP